MHGKPTIDRDELIRALHSSVAAFFTTAVQKAAPLANEDFDRIEFDGTPDGRVIDWQNVDEDVNYFTFHDGRQWVELALHVEEILRLQRVLTYWLLWRIGS